MILKSHEHRYIAENSGLHNIFVDVERKRDWLTDNIRYHCNEDRVRIYTYIGTDGEIKEKWWLVDPDEARKDQGVLKYTWNFDKEVL